MGELLFLFMKNLLKLIVTLLIVFGWSESYLNYLKPEKKKCVEYLYIEADEDHIHKQEKTGLRKRVG